MIDLNVKGTVATNILSLEYMDKDCGIINVASVAGYQPIPYINVYGASKSFVLNFTRALNKEVKKKGIKMKKNYVFKLKLNEEMALPLYTAITTIPTLSTR